MELTNRGREREEREVIMHTLKKTKEKVNISNKKWLYLFVRLSGSLEVISLLLSIN